MSRRETFLAGEICLWKGIKGSIPLSNLNMTRVPRTCKGIRLSHKEAIGYIITAQVYPTKLPSPQS